MSKLVQLKKKVTSLITDVTRFIQYGDLPTSYYIRQGLKVGKNFERQSGTRIDPLNCYLIEMGDDVGMANCAQIIAHDFSPMRYTGCAKFGKVVIGNRVLIGAHSIVLMNVTIGDDVVICAGSLVDRNIPSNSVVAGVPAKIIGHTTDFASIQLDFAEHGNFFEKKDTPYVGKKNNKEKIKQYLDEHPHKPVYIRFRDSYHKF